MNLKTGILILTVTAGTALAQNAGVAQNTRNPLNTAPQKQVQQKPAPQKPGQATKPAAGSPSAAVVAKPVASSAAPAVKPSAPKTAHASDPFQKSSAAAAQGSATTASAATRQTAKPVKAAEKKVAIKAAKPAPVVKATAAKSAKNGAAKDEQAENSDQPSDKKYAMTGKRDPFLSPVVASVGGSGCSTGKKCLEIGQIALKGVVHGEAGFIAVVTNTLNKAYFLRENDPVFNGYVVKITGDSIIFRETYQDRLGKSFTREITKKITTPAV